MIPRDFLSRCARNFPEKAAYHCGERYVTWSQIHARSWRLAGGLQRVGLSKGDVVAVLGQESIEIYEHLFACMNVGFGRVGINWRYAAAEMLHVIEDSGAKALLVDARCEQQFAAIRDRTKCVGITTIGYGGAIACDYEYEDLFGGELKVVTPELSDEEPLLITYTSGSTGKPKGVIHSQRSVASIITQSVIGRGLSPDDIWYTAAASSWMTVLLNIQGILNGMTHVIVDGAFEIRRFLGDAERHRVTVMMLVPTLIVRAIEEVKSRSHDLRSLRAIMYGSSPATPELIRAAYNTFNCQLVQSYGMTECGWVTQLSASDHRMAIEENIQLLGSAGRPGTMSEIEIRDADGKHLATGQIGEIWIRSEMLMNGYMNLPHETAQVLRDGWLSTNDIGCLDENGYLFLHDRKNFMIITGAVNVFPSTVEVVLREHDAVAEVVVVGAPDPEWGEAIVAVIKLKNGIEVSEREVVDFSRQKLSKMECPKRVFFVEEFPLTVTSKIDKRAVKAWVGTEYAAQRRNRNEVGMSSKQRAKKI